MTTTDTRPPAAVALPHRPDRVGQATAVEQSRAAAEVHAAILVAQQCPREMNAARQAMEYSCGMKELAERAFFRYSRGGTQISGPSVHLARELARTWGNVQYGVAELRRDDEHGQSEMQSYAWDVQTNTRNVAVFIVPHKRDKTGGAVKLVDMRDIYENNANAGARRVRECIFGILPPWFVEKAKKLCHETLSDGGDIPLPKRIEDAVAAFGVLGISERRLVAKLGRPSAQWEGEDLATLRVIHTSITRGEMSKDEEFPPDTATAKDITGAIQATARPTPEPATDTAGPTADREQINRLMLWFMDQNIPEGDVLFYTRALAQRDEVETVGQLTRDEASVVLTMLDGFAKTDDPVSELQAAVAEWYDRPETQGSA